MIMREAIRPNPVRRSLKEGGYAFGTMAFEFFTPGLPAVLAHAGAEFAIFDMEHSGASVETMKMLIAASHGAKLAPFVRVPGSAYHLIAPVLDAGAHGIMVPMVETKAQAKAIADACRYRPEGVRGLAFGIGHDEYSGGDVVAKMREANERTLVIALIETATGIANVDAIMAVPGIDVGWLGHFDLTNSMGITGQFEHPDFVAAVDKLVTACERHGKAAGFLPHTPELARIWAGRGFRCLGFSTDIALLQGALGAGIASMREASTAAAAKRKAKPGPKAGRRR
jgi:2-keto-3-deoxy-L-rhamnonate aldolase RhmA